MEKIDEQLNDIKGCKERIDVLYDELKAKVTAYVYKHQGGREYIDTQLDKHNDMIYAIVYDFDLKETVEMYVYGVRVWCGDLQVALEPLHDSYKAHWDEQDFKESQWSSVDKDDCEIYFRVTLDNIADYIEEYVEEQ